MRVATLATIAGLALPTTAAKFMILAFDAAAVTYSWNVTDWKLSSSNGVYDYCTPLKLSQGNLIICLSVNRKLANNLPTQSIAFKVAADPLRTGTSNTIAIPGFKGTCAGSGPEDILPTTCSLLSSDPVSDNVTLSAGIVKNNSPYLRFGSPSLQQTYGGVDHLEVYMIFSSTV